MSEDATEQAASPVESSAAAAPEAGSLPAQTAGEVPAELSPEEAAARQAEAERENRRLARIKAAEEAESRTAQRLEEQRYRRGQAALQREREQWEAQKRAEAEREERARQERRERLRTDGIGALKELTGLDYTDLTREEIARMDPNMRAMLELQQENRAMKEKVSAFDEWKAEQERQAQIARAEQGLRVTMERLDASADDYPHAFEMSAREQRAAIMSIAQSLVAQGERATVPKILRLLDEEAKALQDERAQRRAMRGATAKPSDGGQANPATPLGSTATRSEPLRTLTNGGAAPKAAVRELSDEEKDELLRKELREALRKDAEKQAKGG